MGCDNKLKAFASERIGLYFKMRDGKTVNFCDIHMMWTDGTDTIHEIYYSGPMKTLLDGSGNSERTEAEKRIYEKHGEVGLENDIEEGGRALFIHSEKRKSFDFWLLGPISFQDKGYGSLIVELEGFFLPNILTKHFKKPKMVSYFSVPQSSFSWTHFPKHYVGKSGKCNILASNFYEKNKFRYGRDVYTEELSKKRPTAWAVDMPADVKGIVWKIEAASGQQTECSIYKSHG